MTHGSVEHVFVASSLWVQLTNEALNMLADFYGVTFGGPDELGEQDDTCWVQHLCLQFSE